MMSYKLSNTPIFVIIYEKDSKFPVNFGITIDKLTISFSLTVEQTWALDGLLLHDSISFGAWTEQCQHNKNLKLEAYWMARGDVVICYTNMRKSQGVEVVLTSQDAKDLSNYINVSLKSNSLVKSKSISETDEDPLAGAKRRTDANLRKMFGHN